MLKDEFLALLVGVKKLKEPVTEKDLIEQVFHIQIQIGNREVVLILIAEQAITEEERETNEIE